jgi:hypothetical protein
MRFEEIVEELHVKLVVLDDEHGLLHRRYPARRRTRAFRALVPRLTSLRR